MGNQIIEQPARQDHARADCIHCGLPLSAAQRRRQDPYCCKGCERVYLLIHDEGLERFYDLRRGSTAPPASLRKDSLAWFERLLEENPASDPKVPQRITLDLQGVHCAACVWLLQTLFRRYTGAHQLVINPSLGKADLYWTPALCDLRPFIAEAEKFGYRFGPSRKPEARRARGLAIRLGISIAAAMNVMIFSLCFYIGLAPTDGAIYTFFGRLNLALALLTVLVGGSVFIRSAWFGLRKRIIHLDLPIALGIVLAFCGSVYAYVAGGPEAAYFDTVTIFVALMLVGRWMQERVLERNRNLILASEGVDQLFTRRRRDGEVHSIPVGEIETGDELWIVPGDLVPVEGTALRSAAELSLDWITGESDTHRKDPGETIPAGAFNAGTETFRIAAEEPFETSRLQDLLRSARPESPVDAGDASREDRRWWQRVATVYVIAVVTLALGGLLTWIARDATKAIEVTVAILVVSCPCALGLATPLAHELTHLALRRRGIFLRNGAFFDKALSIRKVLFDKTGTLTLGRMTLTEESTGSLDRLTPNQRETIYNMVLRSNHPVSRALLAALGPAGTGSVEVEAEVREIAGQGLTWQTETTCWRLGRRAFALQQIDESGETPASNGITEVLFSRDGALIAAFQLEEEIKLDAVEEVGRLIADGLEVRILSGDDAGRVEVAAARLGIAAASAEGRLTPEAKAGRVRDLDRRDTIMVGDGLNDAPSFDAAYCAATPMIDRSTLPAKADFYFLGEGIGAVRRSIRAARRLREVVRGNLVLAVLYNAFALSFCYLGLVTPVVAAILMPISSIGVVTLTAFRLARRQHIWMS